MDVTVKAATPTGYKTTRLKVGERKNLWLGLIGWLLVCYSASVTGDIAAAPNLMGWYNSLNKPFFTPTGDLFRPVWTLIYTTMAFSAWRLWMLVPVSQNKRTFVVFFVQLALNIAWPFVFFAIRDLNLAFIMAIFLLIAIVATIYMFRRIDQMSSYLLYPYAFWVSFTTVIAGEVWVLN